MDVLKVTVLGPGDCCSVPRIERKMEGMCNQTWCKAQIRGIFRGEPERASGYLTVADEAHIMGKALNIKPPPNMQLLIQVSNCAEWSMS